MAEVFNDEMRQILVDALVKANDAKDEARRRLTLFEGLAVSKSRLKDAAYASDIAEIRKVATKAKDWEGNPTPISRQPVRIL